MKKIFLSILTSALCFTGISPVFAGTTPIQPGCQTSSSPILRNIPPNTRSNLFSINISNAIAVLLNAAESNANILNITTLLSNGDGNGAGVTAAQNALSSQFASLGINVDAGSSVANLINALTGLIPANFNAGDGQKQTVDLSKLALAIESFNQIVNGLADTANGSDAAAAATALATLESLSTNQTFTVLSTALASISTNL